MQLEGKTALITGATGGLGRAIATALAGRGASLVLSSRKGDELDELATSLPGRHRVLVCDLAEPGAALQLVADAGEIDVLVANAALPGSGRLTDYTTEQVSRGVRVNLEAPMLMAHTLIPTLTKRGGHMVFIGSLSSRAASPRASIYNATKFGIRGFALGMREDLRADGVGVSLVMPGFIRDAGMFADSGAATPPGMGTATPEDVGRGVVKAIEKNKAEVDVAPVHQVVLAKFAGRHPELAGRMSNRQAVKSAEELASGQTEKR